MKNEEASRWGEVILNSIPAEVLAAGMAKVCEHFAGKLPSTVENIVINSWLKIAPVLKKEFEKKEYLDTRFSASALLLEAYFEERGDWQAMQRGLLKGCRIDRNLADKAIEMIFDVMTRNINASEAMRSGVGDPPK